MKIDVLTLFPKMFDVLKESVIGNAFSKGIFDLSLINIRDFSNNKNKNVDDYIYGGGPGMLMKAGPIYDAYKSLNFNIKPRTFFLSPQGKIFNQKSL